MTKFYLPSIFTWEDVLLYSKIILMIFFIIYDAFILHYQHIIQQSYKCFISCKLKQDTSHHLIYVNLLHSYPLRIQK